MCVLSLQNAVWCGGQTGAGIDMATERLQLSNTTTSSSSLQGGRMSRHQGVITPVP
jgi:hypothetical protein